MNRHTEVLKTPRRRKVLLAMIAAGILLIAAAGTTIAWLGAQSETLSNTFDAATVTCDIEETFSDNVKSDVSIRNTGTMDAYIRVALIPVWKDGGSVAAVAATLEDCSMVWGDGYGTSWVRGADGYYYCTAPVPADGNTPVLIDECTPDTHDDYRFELQISAQAIQALPASAVTGVWDSAVTGVRTDGTLEVMG